MKNYTQEEVNELFEQFILEYSRLDRTEAYDCGYVKTYEFTNHSFEQFKKDKGLIPSFNVNTWYKHKEGALVNYQDNQKDKGYGLMVGGDWSEKINIFTRSDWQEATKEEIQEALTKKAEKLGFKEGVKVVSAINRFDRVIGNQEFYYRSGCLYCIDDKGTQTALMHRGKWAEIIEAQQEVIMSVSDIEEKLGIKNLKITK